MHENDMNSCSYSQFYEDSEPSRNGFHNGHANGIINGLKNHSPSELSASTFEEETVGHANAKQLIMSDTRLNVPSRPSTPLSPPPLPPHSGPGAISASSQSLSHSSSERNSRDESAPKSSVRYDSKEAIRLISSAIDGQIISISEMLAYFTKLVKAERAVQQALSDLCPDLNDNHSNYRPSNGLQRFLSGRRRGRPSATASTQSLTNITTTDTELNKILQNLVSSTNRKARAYSTRALFHRLVTVGQLESLITCHQCLKRTYVEFEGELETQASQYISNLKTCERKYTKYLDQLTALRSKLTSLCDKRTSYNRKTMEALMSNLEITTRKLHLLHNDYLMAISTANHYQQWLHTHLRPCLLNGIERTMQLACEVVWHLLVFGGEGVQNSNWAKELQSGRSLASVMEQNNVNFPAQVHHQFNSALLQRIPSGSLSPTAFVVNDQTRQSFVDLVNTYRHKELMHRETVEQVTRECIQWEEALAQWRAVFASPLPNPWPPTLRGPMISDSSASSVMNSNSGITRTGTEDVSGPSWTASTIPDIHELWQDDRARPVNLCEVSFRLTICEFELCFATCLAEAHAQLVSQLLDAQSRPGHRPVDVSPTFPIESAVWTIARPSGQVIASHGLPDLLEPQIQLNVLNHRLQTKPTMDTISLQSANDDSKLSSVLITSDTRAPRSLVSSPSDGFLSGPRPERNRLWNSVRQSVSRFRSQFTRSNTFRASVGAGPTRTGIAEPATLPAPRALSSSNIVIEREYVSQVSSTTTASTISTTTLTTTFPTLVPTTTNKPLPSVVDPSLPPLHSPSSPMATKIVSVNPPASSTPSSGLQIIRTEETDASRLNSANPIPTAIGEVDINKEPWFHGVLPRAEVERLLQKQGDFLIRQTSKRASCRDLVQNWNAAVEENRKATDGNGSSDRTVLSGADTTVMRMVLSVNWFGHKHFILYGGTQKDSGWRLEEGEFPTIRELLEYHMQTQTPVTVKSGACLITPITRPDWELDNKDVQLVQKIGQGNFGDVYRGYYNGCEVAVKTCRVDMTASDLRRKFLQGETTALNFCHPNIVKLIGIAVRSYPIMIVMEYVPGGSLLTYLRKSKNALSLSTLLLMASDAANGMAYLESKNCLHRDLAARNCLVSEKGRLKIADFGMSREENIYELSDRRGQIPIKWTAPEALATGRYTIKCDVWSYGVLLWEIFSYGDVPYRFWSNPQTREMVESGYRLPAPDIMPQHIRVHMNNCWLTNPDKRPSFAELARSLQITNGHSETESKQTLGSTKTKLDESKEVDQTSRRLGRLQFAVKDKRTREN